MWRKSQTHMGNYVAYYVPRFNGGTKEFLHKNDVYIYFKTIFSRLHAGLEYCFSAVNECIDLPLLFLVAI